MEAVRPECSKCHLKYDKGKRCPRSLFCGHTFCTHCLDQVIAGGPRRCPDCGRLFIALSASQLPTDFNLLKASTSPTPYTITPTTSDAFRYESKSGSSLPASPIHQTNASRDGSPSSSQDLKTSTSLTSPKRFQLPPVGTNVSSYAHSRPSLASAPTRSLSGSSASKLRLSDDLKTSSPLAEKKSKDDVDAPRSTTFSRFSCEELRESRPQSTLSYELPTIRTQLSIGNRESRVSQTSTESSNTVAQRLEHLSNTSGSTETSNRRSEASYRSYTSSDEASNRSTPLESEPRETQSRPISSAQLPLTSRVSRLTSLEQSLTSSTETDASSKSLTSSDPVVSTTSFNSLPRLSKFDKTLRSSSLGISSDTKSEVDEVDRSISTQEREEENLVWRNARNDSGKSRTKESLSTPSHVLKMCRSIATKSQDLSSNEDDEDSRVASGLPSSSQTQGKGREEPPRARSLRQESTDSEDEVAPSRYHSRRYEGPLRGTRAYLTSTSFTDRSDRDNKHDREEKETMSNDENKDPRQTHQPSNNLYSPLTRLRETSETSYREKVKESSSEKWKMTQSFDKENIDTTSTGRTSRTSDRTRGLDRSLSASLKDLRGPKRGSEVRRLSPDRILTRSFSTGLENLRGSESGRTSSSSREAQRLARSSTLSARLSARTSFVSRTIKEENEENVKENQSSTEERYHDCGQTPRELDEDLKPTRRSLSARLMSRTSFLSRTTSEEEGSTTLRRHGRDKGDVPRGGWSPSDQRIRRTLSEDHTLATSDASVYSAEREDKITQTATHRESKSVGPGSPGVIQDPPSLPTSPPPTTGSSSSRPGPPRGRITEDEDVSDHQTDEDESTASEGESWDSIRGNIRNNTKTSRVATDPSPGDELRGRSPPSLAEGRYTKGESKPLSLQDRWRRCHSVDSKEGEVHDAKAPPRAAKHEGFTSQEKPSGVASSSPSTASSWRSRFASSHPSYRSMDSKSSQSPYDSSQARVTEEDSFKKPSSQMPTNTSPGRSSGTTDGEEERLQLPQSITGPSSRYSSWQNRFGRTVQDSRRDLDDGGTSPASKTSEVRSPGSFPRTEFDSERRGDAGGHDQRLTSSLYSATDSSVPREKLSEAGKGRRPSEDGSEDTDSEDSEDTGRRRRTSAGTQREAHTTRAQQRTYQFAASNRNQYRKTLATEGDEMKKPHGVAAEEAEQNKDSKTDKDESVDSSPVEVASISPPRLTRDDPRLSSSDEFDAQQTNPSRPVARSSVQDIWRARNAKNKSFLAARARQSRTKEAVGVTETSAAGVHHWQSRYQLRDLGNKDTEGGGYSPNPSSLRLNFLRSNLQGKTEVKDDRESDSVSTFASQHQKLPRADDAPGGVAEGGTGAAEAVGAEKLDANPLKQHQFPQFQGPEDKRALRADCHTNDDQIESQITATEDVSTRLGFRRPAEPGTDSTDAPHTGTTPSRGLKLGKLTFLETDLDTSQTRPIFPSPAPHSSDSSPTENFTGLVKASFTEESRDSSWVSTSRLEAVDKPKPDPTSPTPEAPPGVGSCSSHGSLLHLYCKRCEEWVCDSCLNGLHQGPPQGGCQVISAREAVVHMKMAHSEFLNSRVNALNHFREELIKLLTECDKSIAEHEAIINQLDLKIQEEQRLLSGIESMKNLALRKMNQVDYWEEVLRQNATRINQSSSSQEIVSAVQTNRSNILANIMGGLTLPEFSTGQS